MDEAAAPTGPPAQNGHATTTSALQLSHANLTMSIITTFLVGNESVGSPPRREAGLLRRRGRVRRRSGPSATEWPGPAAVPRRGKRSRETVPRRGKPQGNVPRKGKPPGKRPRAGASPRETSRAGTSTRPATSSASSTQKPFDVPHLPPLASRRHLVHRQTGACRRSWNKCTLYTCFSSARKKVSKIFFGQLLRVMLGVITEALALHATGPGAGPGPSMRRYRGRCGCAARPGAERPGEPREGHGAGPGPTMRRDRERRPYRAMRRDRERRPYRAMRRDRERRGRAVRRGVERCGRAVGRDPVWVGRATGGWRGSSAVTGPGRGKWASRLRGRAGRTAGWALPVGSVTQIRQIG
jgi:hypothetical protein